MPRRHEKPPPLKLNWTIEGKSYRIDPAYLREVIDREAIPEDQVRRRMGQAYGHIQELLNGKSIDVWGANIVEYGIMKPAPIDNTPIPHSPYKEE